MSTALISAVTTYLALAWTKDIGDAKGYSLAKHALQEGHPKSV